MADIIFSYEPLKFFGKGNSESRISKAMFIRKVDLEGISEFLTAKVVGPFEDSFKESDLESLVCGEFTIKVKKESTTPTVKWKEIYESLNAFLEVRKDDSRAALSPDCRLIEGVGYCIAVPSLIAQIIKLKSEATTNPSGKSHNPEWPKKLKTEKLPERLQVPNRDYRDLTSENGIVVLKTKRFLSGVKENYLDVFQDEIVRWFSVNTGYDGDKNIPPENNRFIDRTLEIEPGSYMQIQLGRLDNPQYEEVIIRIISALGKMEEGRPVKAFRNAKLTDASYVNIKSVYDFLQLENLKREKLVKTTSRFKIVP